jgi:hypothetical protein
MHQMYIMNDQSTPETWSEHWQLVSSSNEALCGSWCIKLRDFISLDYETIPGYSIALRLVDGEGSETFGTFDINVQDVNEKPVITDTAVRQIFENPLSGDEVPFEVEKIDEDGDEMECKVIDGNLINSLSALKWYTDDTTLETWTTSCIFAVDVASLFNFENLKKIKLIVVVRDVSLVFPGTLQSESAIVEINVLNVNEPPWFTGSKNYAFDVNEEMPIENLITLMDTFSDVDEDNQGNAVFQIENITQNQNQGQIDGSAIFTLESTTGILKMSSATDFEIVTEYTLFIKGVDIGGLHDYCVVVVNILDVNESPNLQLQPQYQIAENTITAQANSVLNDGSYTAVPIVVTDPDDDNTKRTLDLTNQVTLSGFSPASASSIFYKHNSSHTSNPSIFEFNIGVNSALNYEVNSLYTLQVTVQDGGGLSTSGTFTIKVDDANDAPHFYIPPPPIGDSATSLRCRHLLLGYDLCLSARKNVEFGQNIGGVVIAEDEDEGDTLTFAIDSQQERNSGSDTDPWRNSAPDQSNNTNRFQMKAIDRTVQFLMDADEGTGRQLYEFGTFEYRIMMEVTDNVVIDTLDIVIVLQDVNYAPVFQNCDVPRVALESDTNNGLGLVQPSVSSIEFIQDVVAVDNTQYLSFSSEYFAINPAWPSFANCVDCGFNLFPMLCCSTQIDNGVGGLNFEKTASHFTYSVSVIDSGPGTEQNSCLLKIYVANRNEAPAFSLTNVETVVNVEESTKVFSTIGKLVVLDPEINGVHDQFLTMTIVQQKMIINSVNEIIPIKFDTIVQSVNEEGRSIFYLRLVDSINFESNAGSFTISFKVEDDGEEILSDSISYAINVIDTNEAPEQGFPGSVVFNLPENAFGGTEVGQVMRDEHFF